MTSFFKRLFGSGGPVVGRLTPQEAQAMLKGGAIMLDVRTPLERSAYRIPGSKAMPLNDLQRAFESLPQDRDIICQCASGSRSAGAARFLAGRGYKAHNLAGGISAWQQAGLPLKRG